MVAAVTCVGNGMVLWGRFSSRDENKVHSLVIRNLAGKLVVINVACKRRPFRSKIEVYMSGDEFLHLELLFNKSEKLEVFHVLQVLHRNR